MCVLALAGVVGFANAAVPKRVGDFSLLDSQGYFHQLSYYDDHKAVALLVHGSGSKATAKAIGPFKDAKAKYEGKIKFFMINPHGTETRAAVQSDIANYGTDIPVLMDDTQLVAEALEIKKTGEVILVRPGSTEILYRGAMGKHFDRAVEQVLAGQPVKKAKARVSGEKVKYATTTKSHGKKVSYSKDVAPILADNCARCHREGGIAPFAMNSHTIVQGFAPMIREVVLTKRMPPGQIDPHIGAYNETYTLTPQETQKLVHWIEAGAKNGAAAGRERDDQAHRPHGIVLCERVARRDAQRQGQRNLQPGNSHAVLLMPGRELTL
jgi:hypothetical protein